MFWILKSLSPETARTAVRQGPMCGLMTAMEEETKSGPSTQAFDLDFTKYFDFIEHSLLTSTLSLFYEFGSKKFNRLSTDSKKYSKCKLYLRLNIQRISAESLGLNLHIFGIKLYNIEKIPILATISNQISGKVFFLCVEMMMRKEQTYWCKRPIETLIQECTLTDKNTYL